MRYGGAFVPLYGQSQGFHGMAAAIKFAVLNLQVQRIVICGYSHCGAIRASSQMHSVAAPVEGDEPTQFTPFHRFDHALQRGFNLCGAGLQAGLPLQSRRKHQGPVRAELRGFGQQGVEIAHGQRVFVDAHQGCQFAGVTRCELRLLFAGGCGRQAGAGKHQQQALWFGLQAGCHQQIVECLNVHGSQLSCVHGLCVRPWALAQVHALAACARSTRALAWAHYSACMRKSWSLSAKLGVVGCTLLVLALGSIGLTLWVTWQLEGGAAAVNEAGRLRMQTWRLAHAHSAAEPQRMPALVAQFEQSLNLLRGGDPARPLLMPRNEQTQQAFAQVQSGWQRLRAESSAPLQATPQPHPAPTAWVDGPQAEAFVLRVDVLVWAIEQQLARLTSILNAVQFMMVALTIFSAVALLYCAYLFVFNPLARLQAGLARVESGDLTARVEVGADLEFGALAAAFNRMVLRLQGLYQTLEARVKEKTERVEAQRARLSALYEAAAFVGRAGTLDELAQGFAKQVRRVAQADACAVRWSDELNQRYLLLAAEGLPQTMVDEEHCIPTGDCYCGQPQDQARTRVIPIKAHSHRGALGHCERAGYDTIISVPMRLQERLVGELNLFYRSTRQLSDEDRELVEAIASHLAGAIEGLRAAALQRETAVAEERGFIARELHDSIAQSLAFLKIQLGLLRRGLKKPDQALVDGTLNELDAGVHESLGDVRELLLHFRTRTNSEDITPALKTTLQKFEHQTGLSTQLRVHGQGLPLAADVQVQVLHVVQEALSNIRKHAQAHQVWVEVQQAPRWRVEVRDDGRGFAESPLLPDETHVGLRIMQERAQRIGATVQVASVPGSGTCVVLQLPERQAVAA